MATSEHFREMQDFLLRLLKRVDDMEVYEIVAAIHDMTTYKMDIRDLIDLMMLVSGCPDPQSDRGYQPTGVSGRAQVPSEESYDVFL